MILTAFAAILFFFLAIRRREWAIYWILASLPTYLIRFSVGPIPATLLEINILILVCVWVFQKGPKQIRGFFSDTKTIIPIFLILAASTVSVAVSPDIRSAAGIWKAYFVEPILFLLVFLDTIRTKKQIVKSLWALGVSITIPAVIAVFQKYTGWAIPVLFWKAEETRRVTSVYGYPNAIGLYFAPILAGMWGILAHKVWQYWKHKLPQQEKKLFFLKTGVLLVLITLGTTSIVFARSRGALLGIAGSWIFYALFWKGKRVFFLFLLVVFGTLFTASPFVNTNPSSLPEVSSLSVRILLWKETMELIQDNPVTGSGLAGFKQALVPYHKSPQIEIFLYPHNIVLNFWAELGIAGLVGFLLVFIRMFSLFKKTPRDNETIHLGFAVMGATVAILVHGLVDVPYFKNDLAVQFWTLFGIMYSLSRLSRVNQP